MLAGIGMALFFAPMANIVLSAVRPEEEGQASGANNAIRELGGVFGVAVLASVFASLGGYESGQAFSDGMNPALIIGGVVVALGAVAAFAIPRSVERDAKQAPSARSRRPSGHVEARPRPSCTDVSGPGRVPGLSGRTVSERRAAAATTSATARGRANATRSPTASATAPTIGGPTRKPR